MDKLFDILFLDKVFSFLRSLDRKHYEKILYNIRKVQTEHDPELFKKLNDDIWELRTLYQGLQYRLLAFWDKTKSENTLVVSTHGFIKKQSKVPDKEIEKPDKYGLNILRIKKKLKRKRNENIHSRSGSG